jgi:predicted PurR-regulated permease PerM
MSIPLDPNPPTATVPAELPTASVLGRVFAFLAGLLLLLITSFISLGMVLVGAAGMGVATFAQRQRHRRISRLGGWLAAVISVAAAVAIVAFVVAERVPPNTWHQMKVAMDSANAASAKQPPPAWIDRMYPGMSQRMAQQPRMSSSSQSAFMMAGFGMAATFLVALWGTLGWAAGMLLGFGAVGRWPGRQDIAVSSYSGGAHAPAV